MGNKRIAIIAPSHLPIPNVKGGAIETLTTALLDENEYQNKFIFDVYSIHDEKAVIKSEEYKNSNFYYYNRDWLGSLLDLAVRIVFRLSRHRLFLSSSFIKFVRRNLIKRKYDYILVEGNFLQAPKLKDLNIPIAYHLHTDILNKNELWTSRVVVACSKILVISNFLKKRIEDVVGSQDKILIFKNAIDTDLFKYNSTFNQSLREELNIPKNNKIMIYCGRLTPIKGVMEALKAFEKAKQKNLTFLIVGGSNFADSNKNNYESQLHAYATNHNLNVIFTGYIPLCELPKYYSIADFSICPSICNEAAGLVIIEAMSCGLPVIATNIGGIPEYAIPEYCELVNFDSNFVDQLSVAITKLTVSNNSRKRNNIDVSQYSKSNYYKQFCKLICEI